MLAITTLRHAARSAAIRNNSVVGVAMTTQRRNYHENIVEHYENPRNVGSLDKNDDSVGTVSNNYLCERNCKSTLFILDCSRGDINNLLQYQW